MSVIKSKSDLKYVLTVFGVVEYNGKLYTDSNMFDHFGYTGETIKLYDITLYEIYHKLNSQILEGE